MTSRCSRRCGPVRPCRSPPASTSWHRPSRRRRCGLAATERHLDHDRAALRPRGDVRRARDGELRRPAAPDRHRHGHRGRGRPPGRAGPGQRPALRPAAEGRRDPAGSLLTPPPELDGLQITVRYRPAAAYQQVGGDWYDAFGQPDGAALLVIGDVVGHNVDAAAAMGQIRSILRGIAYDRPEGPAQVLTRVDGVLTGLRIGTLATALVARLEQPDEHNPAGLRTLGWSSAGHLPPLLLCTDGTVRLLH